MASVLCTLALLPCLASFRLPLVLLLIPFHLSASASSSFNNRYPKGSATPSTRARDKDDSTRYLRSAQKSLRNRSNCYRTASTPNFPFASHLRFVLYTQHNASLRWIKDGAAQAGSSVRERLQSYLVDYKIRLLANLFFLQIYRGDGASGKTSLLNVFTRGYVADSPMSSDRSGLTLVR